jgi:hypothetical protein
MQNYEIEILQYNAGQYIHSNCNTIMFTNSGVGTIYIDKLPLIANTTLIIDGNENERCTHQFNLEFQTPSVAGQQCTVTRKLYV